MKIYLDACCVNRLTDDQSQPRIRAESEAIELILRNVRRTETVDASDLILDRARQLEIRGIEIRGLEIRGYGVFDALHLAFAEGGNVNVLLTTDDKFVRRAARGEREPRVSVRNPVSWLGDVTV